MSESLNFSLRNRYKVHRGSKKENTNSGLCSIQVIEVLTVINASAALTLLEQRPEKIQALSGIRTHDLCGAGAVLYQ